MILPRKIYCFVFQLCVTMKMKENVFYLHCEILQKCPCAKMRLDILISRYIYLRSTNDMTFFKIRFIKIKFIIQNTDKISSNMFSL